jgi:hypothetical protein
MDGVIYVYATCRQWDKRIWVEGATSTVGDPRLYRTSHHEDLSLTPRLLQWVPLLVPSGGLHPTMVPSRILSRVKARKRFRK